MAAFAKAGIDTPQLDAEVLMAHAIGTDRIHVIMHPEQELSSEQVNIFRDYVARRTKRVPLPHLTGKKEFWGLEFEVSPAVLIPRPETETLVDAAIAHLAGVANPIVVDIGAGTGCVAIAIASEISDAVVYTSDVSPEAIKIAKRNAERHDVQVRVAVLEGNLFDPVPAEVMGKVDSVVSNPPYIPTAEIDRLQPEVACYEPRGALDGGPDGMNYHKEIIEAARTVLKPGGWVHQEVGIYQAGDVAWFARESGYSDARITEDLAGIGRIVSARL
jgi:release factor glutamine methyltransferase